MRPTTVLIRISGADRPGITAGLLAIIARHDADVLDMEQIVVRDRLTLDVLVSAAEDTGLLKELLYYGWEKTISVDFEMVDDEASEPTGPRFAVSVIGPELRPQSLAGVTEAIAAGGANIDRIIQLSREPVVSYEFIVSSGEADKIREALWHVAAEHSIDVAMQREGLGRRAKRLVVLDVDSTLVQGEIIDRLAEAAGVGQAVAAITDRAMAGEIDFEEALRDRVAALAGLDHATLDMVAQDIALTPGARTFVRTLKRLGYTVAAVSGGFDVFVERLKATLELDHVFANKLEIRDGKLTGGIVGTLIDGATKADVLRQVAAAEGIPIEQTVAVGDGANDVDMLAAAGLGIAFNARPVVRQAADTALNVPYLDAVLFLLGIRRDDIDEADAVDPPPSGDGH